MYTPAATPGAELLESRHQASRGKFLEATSTYIVIFS